MIEITDELEKILKEELLNWSLSDDGIDRWISRDVSSNIGKIVNDIWDFAEDYNSAVTTTEAGVINNWTRR